MRRSLSAVLLALLIGQTSVSATAQDAADLFASARQHWLRHKYAAASASYRHVLRQHPGTAQDYYQAARAAACHDEPRRALAWLRQAVATGYLSDAQLGAEPDFAVLGSQSAWPRLLAQARTKQQQHEASFDPALVALLRTLRAQDQQYRLVAEAAERTHGINAPQVDEAMRRQTRVDIGLRRQVDSLIARHGYPGRSLVGEYQKETAFLVLQHSPDEQYLPVLMAAAERKELAWSSVALFVDRIKTGRGEPQVYGSQLGPAVQA